MVKPPAVGYADVLYMVTSSTLTHPAYCLHFGGCSHPCLHLFCAYKRVPLPNALLAQRRPGSGVGKEALDLDEYAILEICYVSLEVYLRE